MRKQIISAIMAAALSLSLTACGGSSAQPAAPAAPETTAAVSETAAEAAPETAAEGQPSAESGEKILYTAASFAYPSLDTHTEYYGWYTSIYGLSEALFKIGPDMGLVPCLAESAETEGTVMTVKLQEKAAFSNGAPLTADMVIRNLARLAEVNPRFAFLADFDYEALDDHSFTIDTKEPYPTLKNDLASPECGMIDLDATTDFDLAPVFTGPFVVSDFQPSGDECWQIVKINIRQNEDLFFKLVSGNKLLKLGDIFCFSSRNDQWNVVGFGFKGFQNQ